MDTDARDARLAAVSDPRRRGGSGTDTPIADLAGPRRGGLRRARTDGYGAPTATRRDVGDGARKQKHQSLRVVIEYKKETLSSSAQVRRLIRIDVRTPDTSPLEALSPLAYLAERMAGRRAVEGGERPEGSLHAALDRGDHRAALRALMAEHGAAVYDYCARVLGDATLGADVHQQVFEEAYRDLGKLQRPEHARSWLFGIANHRCLDAIKARRRREKRFVGDDEALADVADEPRDLAERVDATTVAEALSACLRALSAESRMAVLLRFQEGMTYEDMGRMCREKSTTLQARVTRALPLLRRCLEGKGIEP